MKEEPTNENGRLLGTEIFQIISPGQVASQNDYRDEIMVELWSVKKKGIATAT